MRKLSLNDGKLSVDIIPDHGGAMSALRWTAPAGKVFDLLHPCDGADIAAHDLAQMSCHPLAFFDGLEYFNDGASWTVQDASNIRATLTLHQEVGQKITAPNQTAHYQFLQRFELGPRGLHILLTLTNIGVHPLAARIGLQLRLAWRGESILRGAQMPLDGHGAGPGAPQFAEGYRLGRDDLRLCMHNLGKDLRFEWPEQRIALGLASGFGFLGVDYRAGDREIWLTPLSHADVAGAGLLKQGDSLSAALFLSGLSNIRFRATRDQIEPSGSI